VEYLPFPILLLMRHPPAHAVYLSSSTPLLRLLRLLLLLLPTMLLLLLPTMLVTACSKAEVPLAATEAMVAVAAGFKLRFIHESQKSCG
jgi:hypothetical protein